jgi:flavin reductase (DIM6/NTAB) family NADH-FMN oxidoreductase RutF
MDPQEKKVALRSLQYGLQILTSIDGEELAAAGVNWLSQASFEPPLVMIAVKSDNDSHAVIRRSGVFAINVLAEDQLEIAKAFFRTTVVDGATLNGYRYEPAPETGCPLIVEAPYWFEARVTDTIERGDHTVFVAEVVGAGVRDESRTPLLLRATGMNYGG